MLRARLSWPQLERFASWLAGRLRLRSGLDPEAGRFGAVGICRLFWPAGAPEPVDFARPRCAATPAARSCATTGSKRRPSCFALALPSIAHLPDMTRCAASATASAISEPSLVALAIMLLAALDAVSAASSPASRMARRALGLALIAAAAAARPAASISLLIAALAILSTVSLPDEDDELEEHLRADLAIGYIPPFAEKTLQGRNGSRMNPEVTPESRIC